MSVDLREEILNEWGDRLNEAWLIQSGLQTKLIFERGQGLKEKVDVGTKGPISIALCHGNPPVQIKTLDTSLIYSCDLREAEQNKWTAGVTAKILKQFQADNFYPHSSVLDKAAVAESIVVVPTLPESKQLMIHRVVPREFLLNARLKSHSDGKAPDAELLRVDLETSDINSPQSLAVVHLPIIPADNALLRRVIPPESASDYKPPEFEYLVRCCELIERNEMAIDKLIEDCVFNQRTLRLITLMLKTRATERRRLTPAITEQTEAAKKGYDVDPWKPPSVHFIHVMPIDVIFHDIEAHCKAVDADAQRHIFSATSREVRAVMA